MPLEIIRRIVCIDCSVIHEERGTGPIPPLPARIIIDIATLPPGWDRDEAGKAHCPQHAQLVKPARIVPDLRAINRKIVGDA